MVRSNEEIDTAARSGFTQAFALAERGIEELSSINVMPSLAVLPTRFGYLTDGDIIGFQPDSGRFRTLYRRNSSHNSFLVTERCNNYCLMCSQPPRDIDDGWVLDEISSCIQLMDSSTPSFGFTGGEPLLDWQRFIGVVRECREHLPQTAIHVLSNGRAFARTEVATAWAQLQHPDLTVGIPVYSAVDTVHDYVVQAKNAFEETILGILKLKDKGQRVEIRVVLHAITAPRIEETCRWLARNLPFVDHVALMGLENTGFAIANDDVLWIDPLDYQAALADGISHLVSAGVPTSIYNLPRCLLEQRVWPYAAQSISDWKNGYIESCDLCIEKSKCSGFFTSGRPKYSRGIKAILAPDTALSQIAQHI